MNSEVLQSKPSSSQMIEVTSKDALNNVRSKNDTLMRNLVEDVDFAVFASFCGMPPQGVDKEVERISMARQYLKSCIVPKAEQVDAQNRMFGMSAANVSHLVKFCAKRPDDDSKEDAAQ